MSCLRLAGIKCIIAKSFSFIFYINLLTLNMLGIIIKDEQFYNNLTEDCEILVNVTNRVVIVGENQYSFSMTAIEETIYENGGVIGLYSRFKDQGFAELVKQAVVKTEQKTSCGSSLSCSNKDLDW